MNFDRFRRILKARWWFLAAVIIISVFLATRLTEFRNEQLPTREAVATITFTPFLGEVDDTGAQIRLENAESLALEINEVLLAERLNLLAPWEIAAIVRDDRTNQLHFIGRGHTDSQAVTIATDLRDAFLDGDPFASVVDLTAQIESVTDRIVELRRSIAQATAVPPPTVLGETDLATVASLEALQAQVDALRAEYGALSVELLNPVFRSSAAIEEERARVLAALVALQLQMQSACVGSSLPPCLALLPDAGSTTTAPEEAFELQILRVEAEQLEAIFRALIQRSLESPASIGDAELRESRLIAADLTTNQALAGVGGLLVGLIGLMLADRVRKPIWALGPIVSGIALPEIDRRGGHLPTKVWYLTNPAPGRKESIQALRSVVEGLATGGGAVGVVGLGVEPEGIQELGADLAVSLAVSESKVLLIDSNFADRTDLLEYGRGNQDLAKTLAYIDEGNMSADEALSYLRSPAEGIDGLKAMRAGRPISDGSDLLAKTAFRYLLEAAKSQFDVVIVSGASTSSPITQVLSQRLDYLILVGSAGHSLEGQYATAIREFSDRRAEIVGLALLSGSRRKMRRAIGRLFGRKPADRPDPMDRALPSGRHENGSDTSNEPHSPTTNGETPQSARTSGGHERSADSR